MMATDIPQEGGSSTRGPDPAAMPAAPPIVSAPSAADDPQSFPDPMNDCGTRPKRTGKVRLECMLWFPITNCCVLEAIRLHEVLDK